MSWDKYGNKCLGWISQIKGYVLQKHPGCPQKILSWKGPTSTIIYLIMCNRWILETQNHTWTHAQNSYKTCLQNPLGTRRLHRSLGPRRQKVNPVFNISFQNVRKHLTLVNKRFPPRRNTFFFFQTAKNTLKCLSFFWGCQLYHT